jgi:hypothetical protein
MVDFEGQAALEESEVGVNDMALRQGDRMLADDGQADGEERLLERDLMSGRVSARRSPSTDRKTTEPGRPRPASSCSISSSASYVTIRRSSASSIIERRVSGSVIAARSKSVRAGVVKRRPSLSVTTWVSGRCVVRRTRA